MRSLKSNVAWTLAAFLAPLPAGAVAIPLLIRGLGTDRFGLLALVWATIGYFSLFDLGIGRALTQLVASKLADGRRAETPDLVATSMALMTALGVLGGGLLWLSSDALATHVLKAPLALQAETRRAIYWVAVTTPLVTIAAGLRGILEAHERFDLLGPIRAVAGVLTFLAPLAILPFSQSLDAAAAALFGTRLAGWLAHAWACVRIAPEVRSAGRFRRELTAELIRFGGWMTVSNIISPLMVTMDRYLIGSMVSVAAVAYYASPSEAITKLLILPSALVTALFPRFSGRARGGSAEGVRLYEQAIRLTAVALFPLSAAAVLFAREGLTLWLGAEFARHSYRVLQLLACGVFVNSIGYIPATLIQAEGRPDLTAKFHLLELPLYAGAVWWAVQRYGIEGAAAIWSLRIVLDTSLLSGFARRWTITWRPLRDAALWIAAMASLLALALAEMGVSQRLAVCGIVAAGYVPMLYRSLPTGGMSVRAEEC